jgi:tetratricopeptide (TPR) repeat protein
VEAPPILEFDGFLVGFYEYEIDSSRYVLYDQIKNDLEAVGFHTVVSVVEVSNPRDIFAQQMELDFFIVLAITGDENQVFKAYVYSKWSENVEEKSSASEIELSNAIRDFLQNEALNITLISYKTDTLEPVRKTLQDHPTILSENQTGTSTPENFLAGLDQVESLKIEGLSKFQDGNFEAAAETFLKVLEIDHDQWSVHYYLSECYRKLKNPAKEWEQLQLGLEIDPENDYLLLLRGNYLYRMRNYAEAIVSYRALINTEVETAARFNLSLVYEQTRKYAEAKEILEENQDLSWDGDLRYRRQEQLFKLEEIENQIKQDLRVKIAGGSIAGTVLILAIVFGVKNKNSIIRRTAKSENHSNEARDKKELLELIDQGMNISELQELCFVLGLDWDNLSGETKNAKAISLIEHFANRKDITRLREEIAKLRPDLIS